jgi:uncharacterized RDD family membrane protein YckC
MDWIICSILIAVLPLEGLNHSDVIIVSNYFNILPSFTIEFFIIALYSIFFLVHYQATPGKMAFSLRVISENHQNITYGMAAARFFIEMIGAFFMFLGYIIAIFDIKKRAFHDRICHTYVVQTTQVVYPHSSHLSFDEEFEGGHPGFDDIYTPNKYGVHTVLFNLMIFEALFSAAYCIMEDPLFRMLSWILNFVIGIILVIAIFKQRYPTFSNSIRRLTWGICLYYCVIAPVVYFFIFLIGIEHFLHEVPLEMDNPILFIMQLIMSIIHYLVFFSWPKLLVSIIFIPCSLILGVWGVILVSACKLESDEGMIEN